MADSNKIYIIPDQPIPLARPRFSKYGTHVWDSQQAEKNWVATYLRFLRKEEPLEGPLKLSFEFNMKHAKKKGYHMGRPDIDNLVKFYMDCLNGILYEDDKQVVSLVATKVYNTEPCTKIYWEEL